jgi:hypothetical protein
MGSNGLTMARHDVLSSSYKDYAESFDPIVPNDLVYTGSLKINEKQNGHELSVGKMILSPTRTFSPIIREILDKHFNQIHGMVHCTGGGQTKILHFIDNLKVVKDNVPVIDNSIIYANPCKSYVDLEYAQKEVNSPTTVIDSFEEVIDYDLIREQIKVAAGIPISGKNYYPQMHAIECRINAEDVYNNFRPSPGTITTFHAPGGHGVRLDTHAYAGYTIPPNYDSMIAKLITIAQSREEAIAKMKRALAEFVIDGIKTTIPFHRKLMEDPDFNAGNYTTKFLETFDYSSKD